ncbi:hypothetical protein ACT7C2_13710 [Bacillus pacificus]
MENGKKKISIQGTIHESPLTDKEGKSCSAKLFEEKMKDYTDFEKIASSPFPTCNNVQMGRTK